MSKFKKWLLPAVILCSLLVALVGCNSTPASLGEVFDPSGNPFAHRFSDVTDLRATTFIVAASNSEHKFEADYFCNGVNDHIQIQAALDALPATGGCIFLLDGTFTLGAQVARAIDDVKFMGCGQATLLNLDGGTPIITAGVQDGWLFAHFASDAGGPSIAAATQSAIRSVWIAGVRTDDPAAAGVGGDAVITVAANNTPAAQKARADFTCPGANDQITIAALVAAGVTVKLMVGDFIINDSLVILVSNFRLEGSGPGTVIAGVIAADYIIVGNGTTTIDRVTICDLRIDGTSQTGANHGIHLQGANANHLTNISILNCHLHDMANSGVKGTYTFESLFIGNYLIDNGARGIDLDYSDFNTLDDNTMMGNLSGIQFSDCDDNTIVGNTIRDQHQYGITIANSDKNTIVGNTCKRNDTLGIALSVSCHNTVTGNTCDLGDDGIALNNGSNGNTITGNSCRENDDGIYINESLYNTITGNIASENNILGINLSTVSSYNVISSNIVQKNGYHGIYLIGGSSHNTITGNLCTENSQVTDNTYSNIHLAHADYNLISDNICRQGVLASQPQYGIDISNSQCDCNIVRDNDLYDSGKTGPIQDLGTGTKFNNITFQFIQGTTFIDADGSAKGWEIDIADEFAIALGQLPLELLKVVRIKIWGVGLAAPNVGNGMLLEINMNAGQDDEIYTAEAIAIANKVTRALNFAVNDVIVWIVDATDDANIGDLIGGDSLEVKVKFETLANGDIDTNAVLRAVEIEYVT